MRFDRVAKMKILMNLIMILSPDPCDGQKASGFQVVNNSLNRSFGDSDLLSDFTKNQIRLLLKQNQHVGVVGQEGPVMGGGSGGRLAARRFLGRSLRSPASRFSSGFLLHYPGSDYSGRRRSDDREGLGRLVTGARF